MVSRQEVRQFISRHDYALSALFVLLLLFFYFATNDFDLQRSLQGIKPSDVYSGIGTILAGAICVVAQDFLTQAFQPTASKALLALALFLLLVPFVKIAVTPDRYVSHTAWAYLARGIPTGEFPTLHSIDIVLVLVGLLICYGVSAVALHLIYKTPGKVDKRR
ncbi:MAG: hypothetical protein WC861_05615 [Candidatus Micrarchaeia archaeon]|jgi:hypothetical protein